jgi:hypothetical protein
MLGSVWLPIMFCLVMMAVCCDGPLLVGTLAACPPPTSICPAGGETSDRGGRRGPQGAG